MRKRTVLRGLSAAIALLAGLLLARWWHSRPSPLPAEQTAPPAALEIQDGMVIEPSGNALIQRNPTTEEKAKIDQAVREMEEAMREATFSVPPPRAPGRSPEPGALNPEP